MLNIFRVERFFESLKCCLDLWLSSMLDCIHICVFLSLEKLFLSNLDSFLIDKLSIKTLQLFLIAFSIALNS